MYIAGFNTMGATNIGENGNVCIANLGGQKGALKVELQTH